MPLAAFPLLVAVVLWTSVSLTWPSQSQAREWLGLAGTEMAEQGSAYAFAGAIVPLGTDAVLGQGWVQRYWLDSAIPLRFGRRTGAGPGPGIFRVSRLSEQRRDGLVGGLCRGRIPGYRTYARQAECKGA